MNNRKRAGLIFSSIAMCLGTMAVPICAEETNTFNPDDTDTSEFSQNSADVAKQFQEIEEAYAKQSAELISNHSQVDDMLSIKMDLSEMHDSFQKLKEEFDKNLADYGTIDIFADDEEGKEIKDSLDDQDEQNEIDSELKTYNSSGWITADKTSTNKKTKTKYNTQKTADSDYNAYQAKYKDALKSFKSKSTKEDMVDTSKKYPEKIDAYEVSVSKATEEEKDKSKTSILSTPKIDGIVLSASTNQKASDSSEK